MKVIKGGGKQTVSLDYGDTYTQYEIWLVYEDSSGNEYSKCVDVHTNQKGAENNCKAWASSILSGYYIGIADASRTKTKEDRPLRAEIRTVTATVNKIETTKIVDVKSCHNKVIKDFARPFFTQFYRIDLSKLEGLDKV